MGIVVEPKELDFRERLKRLKHTDFELRRKRGDLIQVYKVHTTLKWKSLGIAI